MIRKYKRSIAKPTNRSAAALADRETTGVPVLSPDANAVDVGREQHLPVSDISGVENSTDMSYVLSSDEETLNLARSYWQFGQWDKLAEIEVSNLDKCPKRGKLALLVAAGHQQLGNHQQMKKLTRQAVRWGVSFAQINQVLMAGLSQTLGRIALIIGNQAKADALLSDCIDMAMPGADVSLWLPIQQKIALNQIDQQRKASLRNLLKQEGSLPESFHRLAEQCLARRDVQGALDEVENDYSLSPDEKVLWYLTLSRIFAGKQDRLTAEHFVNQARFSLPADRTDLIRDVVKQVIAIGRTELALEMALDTALSQRNCGLCLEDSDEQIIREAFVESQSSIKASKQHGQLLLLEFLTDYLDAYRCSLNGRQPVLIEIGTTREEVTGQGSTRQLAEFCKKNNLHFVTVDMDPHNSRLARSIFSRMNCEFEAITEKGEDFLTRWEEPIDFVFIDAYDFDHGKHSELRQSRYEQFLGSRIDEQRCHQMHLECAQSLVNKLESKGVICFDDTWLDNGRWTAKGTLAMPFLLECGFEVLDARNRAVLLSRKQQ